SKNNLMQKKQERIVFNNMCFFLYGLLVLQILKTLMMMLPLEHDDKTKREAKGKSHVESSIGYRNLSAEFKDFSDNSINEINAIDSPVPTVGPTHGKSSYVNTSQYLDDPNMPELEDITYPDDEEDINNDDFYTCMFACFLSQEEPKRVHQALKDPSWIEAMQEKLLQFKMQKEEEGIDYEEVFALVARIEAIRLFLAYASFMGFMVYQMNVKSAFLYGTIKEE
nr:hypothetical protein [Tanacetum cinerariifolium]